MKYDVELRDGRTIIDADGVDYRDGAVLFWKMDGGVCANQHVFAPGVWLSAQKHEEGAPVRVVKLVEEPKSLTHDEILFASSEGVPRREEPTADDA